LKTALRVLQIVPPFVAIPFIWILWIIPTWAKSIVARNGPTTTVNSAFGTYTKPSDIYGPAVITVTVLCLGWLIYAICIAARTFLRHRRNIRAKATL
jgi:hypothetical protein